MAWSKKKRKGIADYYRNELMRSRMSPISIRTDEIIQQYFFVAKDQYLNLDEYLRIRELSTKELGLKEQPQDYHECTCKKEKRVPDCNPLKDDAEVNRLRAVARDNSSLCRSEADSAPQSVVPENDTCITVKPEVPSEPHREPERARKAFSDEDFLAMMQSVED